MYCFWTRTFIRKCCWISNCLYYSSKKH